MKRSPFKAILAGILLGAAVFFIPFLPGLIFAFLLTGLLIRMIFFRRHFYYGRRHFGRAHWASSFDDDRDPVIPIDGRRSYSTPIYGSDQRSFPVY